MAVAIPAFAIVRPRVVVTRTGESLLVEDAVAEIFEEYGSGFVPGLRQSRFPAGSGLLYGATDD